MVIAALIVAIVSGFASLVAIGYARSQARTSAGILHDSRTPEFRLTWKRGQPSMLRLEHVRGPALDSLLIDVVEPHGSKPVLPTLGIGELADAPHADLGTVAIGQVIAVRTSEADYAEDRTARYRLTCSAGGEIWVFPATVDIPSVPKVWAFSSNDPRLQ